MAKTVFYVSDRTGITAESLGSSLISQFPEAHVVSHTIPFVDDAQRAQELVQQINEAAHRDGERPIVFGSIVDDKIREIIKASQSHFFDLFETFLPSLALLFHEKPSFQIGKAHGMSNVESYNARMEAVNFALANDDGQTLRHFHEADIIVVGVSRSGKTPTCLYLAMTFGVKAANYPLVPEDLSPPALPSALMKEKKKIVGLTIAPTRLSEIRSGRKPNSVYAALATCQDEVRKSEQLFKQEQIPFLNSTTHSIEEIATQMLLLTGFKRGAKV